jgi:hypothetical protein
MKSLQQKGKESKLSKLQLRKEEDKENLEKEVEHLHPYVITWINPPKNGSVN